MQSRGITTGDQPSSSLTAQALSVLAAVGFVRIVTNRRIDPAPTPPAVALGVVQALTGRPGCRVAGPGARHLELVSSLCRSTGAAGKAVADAQHAAIAIEHGCTFAAMTPLRPSHATAGAVSIVTASRRGSGIEY